MNIKIACVGKLKDRFYEEGAAEYCKRLSRFCKVQIAEVPDERIPDDPHPSEEALARQKEGERLLAKISPNDYVITMCIDAPQRDSVAFAGHLQALMDSGKSNIAFVIGGSVGLSEAVLARGNEQFSLSKMTMPHRLCRVFLLEQLFRAFKINAHEAYHK